MTVLNGWKEIADCLNLTTRSAQRWERLGLPVRRVSDSGRGPVVAFSDEVENWLRRKQVREDRLSSLGVNVSALQSTRRETEKLLREMRQLCAEQRQLHTQQRQLLNAICYRLGEGSRLSAHNFLQLTLPTTVNTLAKRPHPDRIR